MSDDATGLLKDMQTVRRECTQPERAKAEQNGGPLHMNERIDGQAFGLLGAAPSMHLSTGCSCGHQTGPRTKSGGVRDVWGVPV